MKMTPEDFLTSIVEPNVNDFAADPGSITKCFNAALAASHMADIWFEYNKRHAPDLLKLRLGARVAIGSVVELVSAKTAGRFREVRSIANAYKHLYTDSTTRHGEHACIDSCGAIESVVLKDGHLEHLYDESGEAGAVGNEPRVVFTRRDGTRRDALEAVRVVSAFWHDFLFR